MFSSMEYMAKIAAILNDLEEEPVDKCLKAKMYLLLAKDFTYHMHDMSDDEVLHTLESMQTIVDKLGDKLYHANEILVGLRILEAK